MKAPAIIPATLAPITALPGSTGRRPSKAESEVVSPTKSVCRSPLGGSAFPVVRKTRLSHRPRDKTAGIDREKLAMRMSNTNVIPNDNEPVNGDDGARPLGG
jgi:hypothetical protein